MVITSSNTRVPVVFLALIICSLKSSQAVSGSGDQQRKLSTATTLINIKTDPMSVSWLRDARNYVELKQGSQTALPSSFTICVSVLVTTQNRYPLLFTLLGKDDNQWFAAHFIQLADLFDKMYFYTNANRFVQVETITVFPNQWIPTCIAFDSAVGAVQWVARGKLVGNDTFAFAGISNSSNIPTDLAGKLILGKPSK